MVAEHRCLNGHCELHKIKLKQKKSCTTNNEDYKSVMLRPVGEMLLFRGIRSNCGMVFAGS